MRKPPRRRQSPERLILCLLFSAILTGAALVFVPPTRAAEPMIDQVRALIRARLDGDAAITPLSCQGEMICGIRMLPLAYRNRNHLPLWIDALLRLEKAEALAEAIRGTEADGLSPWDYHLEAIYDLLADICEQASTAGTASVSPALLADLDLILSDAFLLVGSHLAAGRVNPETLHTDWKINPEAVDLLASLDEAVSSGDIDAALQRLRPAHDGYRLLRDALARLRGQAAVESWPPVASSRTLWPGMRNYAVGQLRRRLAASGDFKPVDAKVKIPEDPFFFDDRLATAVRRFQQRNGLKADGRVEQKTYDRLNVSVDRRIRQMILNLERWRWLPHDLGARYVLVNTADFNLDGVENGQVVLRMRVVVGKPARRSPVFSTKMTYLVVNPYWNVPPTIAVEDILPKIQRDISYLTPRGIRVFQSWQKNAAEVDPATVDWQTYHADRFPFKLRQDPGPYNSLGSMKFMFPNPFAVYLHGTPNRLLFNLVERDVSSGCIRVESPAVLANFVLAENDRWTVQALTEIIEKGDTRVIWLDHPIPVHLVYMTAWVNAKGVIQFRRDIYDRDRDLEQALGQRRANHLPAFTSFP